MRVHWGFLFLVLLVGYFLGIYWPGPGASARAALGA